MTLFQDAMKIYKDIGLQLLLYRVIEYVRWKLRKYIANVFDFYWDLKGGSQIFTINGVSAEFGATKDEAGDSIRGQINMEYEMIEDLLEEIEENDVFYDIGANVGVISHFAGQVCSDVIAFEPYPPNYTQLVDTLSDTPANIQAYNLALSDSEGEVKFSGTEGKGQGTGSIGTGDITVNTNSGDNFISQEGLKKPDIIKIDVEGAEGLVITGMEDALKDARRVYCEIHLPVDHRTSVETYGWTAIDILTKLSSLGYNIQFVNNRRPELEIICEKTED